MSLWDGLVVGQHVEAGANRWLETLSDWIYGRTGQ